MPPEEKHLEAFRKLGADRLVRMNLAWIQFERAGDPAPARAFMREAHTLKGEAGFMGYTAVARLAHGVEDLVGAAQARAGAPEAAVGDRVLQALDLIARMILLEAGAPEADALAEGFLAPREPPPPAPPLPEEPAPLAPPPLERTAARVTRQATARHIVERADLAPEGPPRTADEIRVTSEKLDRMRDVVGELMLLRTRLAGAARELRLARGRIEDLQRSEGRPGATDRAPHGRVWQQTTEMLGDIESRLRTDDHQMDRLMSELEATTRDLRMVPVKSLFEQYPRHVRALAKQLGKRVKLRYEGESTEVDRAVLALIEEPLLHLVRNALDHGIEAPDARAAAGKDAEGALALTAGTVGQMLEILVADDGAGLDFERIRARALELGLCTGAEAPDLRPFELQRFVFEPGFSTRPQATDVSGRGIGLDVVMSSVEAVGGTVILRSTQGLGTSFVLSVPIRVAITSILLFRVGAGRYALPAAMVVGLVDDGEHPLLESIDGPRLSYEGRLVPVLGLAAHLGERIAEPAGRDRRPRLVLARSGDQLVALRDSAEHQEREVVLKTDSWVFASAPLIRGMAPLEDGTLAAVLKASALVGAARGHADLVTPDEHPRADAQTKSVIVADDSPVIRDLVAEALRSHGLQVIEAADGEEAWTRLQHSPATDLVVTDVEMPRLDGLGLIARIRAEMPERRLPIVVVSMRGSDDDRQRALDLGADAYLVKTDFSHRGLWAMIERFLR